MNFRKAFNRGATALLLTAPSASLLAAEDNLAAAVGAASAVYGRCVVARAEVMAKSLAGTNERAEDIANAAFAYCFSERAALRQALTTGYQKSIGLPSPDLVDQHLERTDRDVYRAALRGVIEARHPSLREAKP